MTRYPGPKRLGTKTGMTIYQDRQQTKKFEEKWKHQRTSVYSSRMFPAPHDTYLTRPRKAASWLSSQGVCPQTCIFLGGMDLCIEGLYCFCSKMSQVIRDTNSIRVLKDSNKNQMYIFTANYNHNS